jgi:hypothetical protein
LERLHEEKYVLTEWVCDPAEGGIPLKDILYSMEVTGRISE